MGPQMNANKRKCFFGKYTMCQSLCLTAYERQMNVSGNIIYSRSFAFICGK
jgi:hypothetical protein